MDEEPSILWCIAFWLWLRNVDDKHKAAQSVNVYEGSELKTQSIHPLSVTTSSLLWGHGGFYWSQSQPCLWVRAGYSLDMSPAHRRALTDGRGRHARCEPHIRSNLGFSILHKDTSTCSSAQPGAGILTGDLPITSWPALLAEPQPPLKTFNWVLQLQLTLMGPLEAHFYEYSLLQGQMWNINSTIKLWLLVLSITFCSLLFSSGCII